MNRVELEYNLLAILLVSDLLLEPLSVPLDPVLLTADIFILSKLHCLTESKLFILAWMNCFHSLVYSCSQISSR
jgi:hypothetical protein